jgi:hypothetical protein
MRQWRVARKKTDISSQAGTRHGDRADMGRTMLRPYAANAAGVECRLGKWETAC